MQEDFFSSFGYTVPAGQPIPGMGRFSGGYSSRAFSGSSGGLSSIPGATSEHSTTADTERSPRRHAINRMSRSPWRHRDQAPVRTQSTDRYSKSSTRGRGTIPGQPLASFSSGARTTPTVTTMAGGAYAFPPHPRRLAVTSPSGTGTERERMEHLGEEGPVEERSECRSASPRSRTSVSPPSRNDWSRGASPR